MVALCHPFATLFTAPVDKDTLGAIQTAEQSFALKESLSVFKYNTLDNGSVCMGVGGWVGGKGGSFNVLVLFFFFLFFMVGK